MQSEILLSTIEEGSPRPSFFELFLMDRMSSMIRPAIRHIFYSASLQSADPDLMMSAFDTLYNFVFNAVEAMCLFSEGNNASFMEGIYGYQRVRLNPDSAVTGDNSSLYLPLTTKQKTLSLLYFLVMPRMLTILKIIRNVAQYLEQLDQRTDEQNSREDSSGSFILVRFVKRLLRGVKSLYLKVLKYGMKSIAFIFPHLLALESMASTIFYILYLLKLTPYHHPLFALLNMELVKKRNLVSFSSPQPAAAATTISSEISVPQSNPPAPNSISSGSTWHLTAVLGIMFTLRAVDWMINSDHSADNISSRLGIKTQPPPPPRSLKVARGGVIPLQDSRLCSLCGKVRSNPCAASSGYVFCYLCILNHVREHGVCPITHLPCLEKDLIRLFEVTSS